MCCHLHRATLRPWELLTMNDTNFTSTESALHTATVVSDHLWATVGIVIIVVGTVGHLLSMTVMVASKTMRVQSSTVYLITMSITGIVTLYTGLLRYVVFIGITRWDVDIRDTSDIFCRLHMTATYASLQYFAWLQATVAVDRLISVLMPHKYMVSCKWKLALSTVLIELLLVILLNLGVGMSVGHNSKGFCIAQSKHFFYNVWGYIDLVSYSLLPALILIVCNSMIMKILKRSKLKVGSSRGSAARSLTVMLMSLNVLFLITTLPVSIVFFLKWGVFGEHRYAVIELCWSVFSLLQYAGSACTFFVYCITGSKFREELCHLFSRLWPTRTRNARSNSQSRCTNSTVVNSSCRPSIASYKSLQVSTC